MGFLAQSNDIVLSAASVFSLHFCGDCVYVYGGWGCVGVFSCMHVCTCTDAGGGGGEYMCVCV